MENDSSAVGWQSILTFWFKEDDIKTLYNKKWFPTKTAQVEMDAYITATFGALLLAAEQGRLASWTDERESCLALIVLLDQFSRHVYRQSNREQIGINDMKVHGICQAFLHKGWHHQLSVPEYVFALMPMRHNDPSVDQLKFVLDEIRQKEACEARQMDLLQKFKRTTQRRLEARILESNTSSEILEHYEFEPDYSTVKDNSLLRSLTEFLDVHVHHEESPMTMIISLSGGVDSMVIAQLSHYIVMTNERYRQMKLVAVHVDYGNRPESAMECAFVHDWCRRHGIECISRRIDEVTRGVTKREEYELVARDIRYGLYRQVLDQFQARGICFGHHRGDVQENVISNLMKGLSLLELNGMNQVGMVNNVPIWRPLLNHDKSDIFDFAHCYGTPYFKDTTPLWSTRGKMRTRLMPLLAEIYRNGLPRRCSRRRLCSSRPDGGHQSPLHR